MEPDYSIRIDNYDGQQKPGRLIRAKGDLITQMIAIDRIMIHNLDRSLRGSWVTAGSELGIKIDIVSPKDITIKEKNHIVSYLSQSKRAIFTAMATLTGRDDFNNLHRKLNMIINKTEQKLHNSLIPHRKIDKLGIAKIIVRLSNISALRIHGPSFIYQDSNCEIMIECDKIWETTNLLDEKPQNNTIHEARFGIKYAPTAGYGDFTLSLDGQIIKHKIEDNNFILEWSSGQKAIRCYDILHANFVLYQQPDPQDNLYRIIKVINVISTKAMIQGGLVLDNSKNR